MIKICLILLIVIIVIINSNFNYDNESFKNYTILDNIKPYKKGNLQSDIAFVTLYTPNISDFSYYSEVALIEYCNKYNYGYYIYNEALSNDIEHGCWNKIPAIQKHLNNHKYLIWIDSDAIINDFNIDIKQFIKYNENKSVIVSHDINSKRNRPFFNSGVMIIKNNDFSNKVLHNTWNSDVKHGYTNVGDQVILRNEICKLCKKDNIDNIYSENKHIKVYPERTFNSYPRLNKNKYHNKMVYKDFIIHYMGKSSKVRIEEMKKSLDRNNIKY
jgi:hypothetical protein